MGESIYQRGNSISENLLYPGYLLAVAVNVKGSYLNPPQKTHCHIIENMRLLYIYYVAASGYYV